MQNLFVSGKDASIYRTELAEMLRAAVGRTAFLTVRLIAFTVCLIISSGASIEGSNICVARGKKRRLMRCWMHAWFRKFDITQPRTELNC